MSGGSQGVSAAQEQSDLMTAVANMQAMIPAAASSVPPGIGVAGALGSVSTAYARSDHTHASSVQRGRQAVDTASNTVTVTFPHAFTVMPMALATVENSQGATQPYVANLVGATLTTATFVIFKAQPTSLGGTLSALLGAIISPFTTTIPAGTFLNWFAGMPTT